MNPQRDEIKELDRLPIGWLCHDESRPKMTDNMVYQTRLMLQYIEGHNDGRLSVTLIPVGSGGVSIWVTKYWPEDCWERFNITVGSDLQWEMWRESYYGSAPTQVHYDWGMTWHACSFMVMQELRNWGCKKKVTEWAM